MAAFPLPELVASAAVLPVKLDDNALASSAGVIGEVAEAIELGDGLDGVVGCGDALLAGTPLTLVDEAEPLELDIGYVVVAGP